MPLSMIRRKVCFCKCNRKCLTEGKLLDFIHFGMNFEKTQCHQKHNDSVLNHVYCDLNDH